jgi:sporulation protein YlmC with PRC-barrel domain
MQQTKETDLMKQPKATDPWWTYLLYASTDVLEKVLVNRLLTDGKNGRTAKGVSIKRTGEIKPTVDADRITATSVIGSEVKGSDGKPMGRIEEVAMDLMTGSISYMVLAVGGVFGIGDKFYAIPLSALTLVPEEKVFLMDMQKNDLKKMLAFDKMNWPKQAQRWVDITPKDKTSNSK